MKALNLVLWVLAIALLPVCLGIALWWQHPIISVTATTASIGTGVLAIFHARNTWAARSRYHLIAVMVGCCLIWFYFARHVLAEVWRVSAGVTELIDVVCLIAGFGVVLCYFTNYVRAPANRT